MLMVARQLSTQPQRGHSIALETPVEVEGCSYLGSSNRSLKRQEQTVATINGLKHVTALFRATIAIYPSETLVKKAKRDPVADKRQTSFSTGAEGKERLRQVL